MIDAIPVKVALQSKGLRIDMFCPRCITKLETTNHVLMECPFAKKVWFGSKLNIKFPEKSAYDFKD